MMGIVQAPQCKLCFRYRKFIQRSRLSGKYLPDRTLSKLLLPSVQKLEYFPKTNLPTFVTLQNFLSQEFSNESNPV